MRRILTTCALFLALPAWGNSPSPYAGMTDRPIRALSAEQQADLLAGRGMGLALAAELNGWPGPLHVIELADAMGLTAGQLAATRSLMAEMQAAARPLGVALVGEERALDAAFRDRTITPDDLSARTARIAMLQGQLRDVHLRTHLAQAALLSQDQIAAYDRLRGYGSSETPHASPHGRHRHH